MKKIITLSLSALILLSPAAIASQQRDCEYDYKVSQYVHSGGKHTDVERAGVLILKDYGQDKKDANDRYTVILGRDRHSKLYAPFAGKVEQNHPYTSSTAAAELNEETGGAIKLPAKTIATLPYVYHGKKQLFFYRDDKASVRDITKACQKACANQTLAHQYREVDKVIEVPLSEILNVASKIQNGDQSNKYSIKSRTQGNIDVEGFYMRIFKYNHKGAAAIGNDLFKVNIFK